MLRRYGLRDDQWERFKDLLPGREATVGVTAKDNRLFIDAVLYRYRAGIPWRDLPARFGDFRVIHTRFSRWAKSGVWARVFRYLAKDADFMLTPGQAHDLNGADALLADVAADTVIADKAFDADERVIQPLMQAGKIIVIPSKSNRASPRYCDKDLYKARHLIENFFAKLKQFGAIATRYDKRARNFLAAIHLASAVIWLN